MFKQFISRPIGALLLFFIITIAIWVGGKFYSPSLIDAKPYQGEQIELNENGNLVIAEGLVTHSGNSRQGMRFLTVKGHQGEFGTTFFPSLGKLQFTPKIGDYVVVTGLLGKYQNKPQISPLSSRSISLKESSNTFPSVTIDQLSNYMGQNVWIDDVTVLSVKQFNSKQGMKMLRFEIADAKGQSVDGVFFESDWDDNTYQILSSKNTVKVLAKVSEFQNKLSLNGKNIKQK
jgi:RecG-like helicase